MDIPSKSSYGASGVLTFLGALTISQIATIIGVVLAVLTFVVNFYFKKKMRQDTREHYRESERIQRENHEDQE
jgi:uncharacterized membrane protein